MPEPAPSAPRVGFVSLGCPKALVDSQRLLTSLRSEGYRLSSSYREADVVVVNTCGFIDSAKAESLEAIGEALEQNGRVIVTGCLGARRDEILAAHPRVLAVTGAQDFERVLSAVRRHAPIRGARAGPSRRPPLSEIRLTPRHYAYLKIAEGCNHRCTFCIIPSMRGPLQSLPAGRVMAEAERLVGSGARELLVIAQDTSAYGADLHYRTDFWLGRPIRSRLRELCAALGTLGVWVRLHYLYPYPHVDEIIPLMAEGRILPYLDVPLQHSEPKILRLMKRPAAGGDFLERVRKWRDACPEITLRSSFIVGFPGETDDDFERLLDFLRAAELDRVGCFCYSPVTGARANRLPGAVPEEVKQERESRLMQLQAQISRARLERKAGTLQQVLVDEVSGDDAIGRSHADAPEIDGRVVIRGGASLRPGDLVEVRIDDTDAHDLAGTLAH